MRIWLRFMAIGADPELTPSQTRSGLHPCQLWAIQGVHHNMERRTALAAAVAGAVTFATATVTMAAVGGLDILGFQGAAADTQAEPLVVKQIATVDEVVVVMSSDTLGASIGATNSAIFGGAASLVLEAVVPATTLATTPAAAPAPAGTIAVGTTTAPVATPAPTPATPAPTTSTRVTAGTKVPWSWPGQQTDSSDPPGM